MLMNNKKGIGCLPRVFAFAIVFFFSCDSFGSALAAPIPDDPKLFSGNPVGLTDLDGQEIVPPLYSAIKYFGHGIFLMTGIDPIDRYHSSDDKYVFNRDGGELKY